jgi:DUF971 family protein
VALVQTAAVTNIELDRELELRVAFDDDVIATFELLELRQHCPCASCRGRREQDLEPFTGNSISAVDAELHGNWGIAIRWSDGHDTGIYAWELLRSWWDSQLR